MYLKVAKSVASGSSHHRKKNFFFFVSVWDDGCSLKSLWQSLHNIYKPSYSIVHLKLITVLYVNDISIKLEKKTRDIGKGKCSFCLHNIERALSTYSVINTVFSTLYASSNLTFTITLWSGS